MLTVLTVAGVKAVKFAIFFRSSRCLLNPGSVLHLTSASSQEIAGRLHQEGVQPNVNVCVLNLLTEILPPDKEDLWNIGLVHKNERNYKEAAPMLEQALEKWLQEDPEDDVTLAKLYDSVGSCYDEMGKFEKAVDVLQKAKDLYDGSIGTESYLYGSARL